MPIRAIPMHGGNEMFFDAAKLTLKQRDDLKAELEKQFFWVQYLHLQDPTHFLVEAEIRRRIESEQEAARKG